MQKNLGMIMKKTIISLSLTALLSVPALADEMDPSDLFEYMKSALKGEWKLSPEYKQTDTTGAYKNPLVYPLVGTDATAVAYKFIGFGSTLQEDLLPDTKKQMVTMYHCNDVVDCTQVLATHYCTKMNQPRFIADLNKSTKERIVFNCNMDTTLCKSNDDHIHKIIMEFSNEGQHLKTSYLGWTDQKPNKKNSIYHFDKK
jgi:hypothetical protein